MQKIEEKEIYKTANVKHTVKDSVFTDLFKDKKYLIQLYHALHPEDMEATEDKLQDITINNVFVDGIYNDIGFSLADDKLIAMVEAQSTFTVNIVIRALLYLVQTYHDYFRRTEQNLYGSKKVKMPKPELYVIFTGNRKEKPEELSLSKEFFGGESIAIDVKVKLIYNGNEGDIIYQYIMFTKVYDEQRKKFGATEKAVRETIRICKERNLLKEYLESKETEVVTIMMALFDEEQILKAYLKSEREEAKEEAKEEARKEAREETLKSVIEICYDLGLTISDTVTKIAAKFNVSKEEAGIKVNQYWKG